MKVLFGSMSENKRCYRCKCLEAESTYKWNIRTRYDLDAKFFCRKCVKKQDIPFEHKIVNVDFKKSKVIPPSVNITYEELCMYLIEKDSNKVPSSPDETYIIGNMKRTKSSEWIKKLLDALKNTRGATPFNRFTSEEINLKIYETMKENGMLPNESYRT